jgi:hypothetical protein
MTRTAAAVALAAALAQPAIAATIYVPFADRLQAGAPQHRTELRLTNTQPSFGQSVSYRVFVDGRAGAVKTILLGPGQSRSVAPGVPAGSSGLIEVNTADGVAVGARLLVERPGNTPSALSIPAFVAESAAPAGAVIVLQGLGHGNGKETGFSIQNFDGKPATCSVAFEDGNGLAIGTAKEIQFPGKSAHSEENVFSALANGSVANGIARISCDRRFWAFALVEETATGEAELVTPALELTPTMTADTIAALTTLTFTKSGTFLISSSTNLNWVYRMYLGSSLTFRKAIIDYDFFVNTWDPKKPSGTHEILWFQKGSTWKYDMMAYVNSKGSSNSMRWSVNYGTYTRVTLYPGVKQKTNYHMHYEWDGILKKNFYNILYNGSVYTRGSSNSGKGSFTTSAPFIGMGGQTSCSTCPESKEPGLNYSNLVVQFIP